MILNDKINEAYRHLYLEAKQREEAEGLVVPVENPFTISLYDRIVEDLEDLEVEDGEFSVTNVSIGPNCGVLVELSLDTDVNTTYTLEYIEHECIYWQIIKEDDYFEGCSQEIPF